MTEQTEITKHTEAQLNSVRNFSVPSVISECCGHLSACLFIA